MTPETQDRFEERLLTQLRAHVAHNAPAPEPPARRRRLSVPRPAQLALGGAVAAGAAAAVIVLTGGDGSQPAYAVTPHDDGTVTVSVRSLSDAAGLERELRAAGVRAEVRNLPDGMMCAAPDADATAAPVAPTAGAQSASTGTGPATIAGSTQVDRGTATMTVTPATLPEDATLLIATSGDDAAGPSTVAMTLTTQPGAACKVVPAPARPVSP